MASNWADETGGQTPFSKAPSGLRQSRIQDETGGAQPWLRPAWQTGGQIGSTANAFNDDFFVRMYDQYEQERQKVEKDPDYVSNLFARKDFTGIVGWDQQIKKDNPFITVDEDRQFNVGDIYDNGQFLGNVYDMDSGLSLDEANAMVAPHIWGDKAADKFKEANGDQEKLKSLILQTGKEEGQKVEAYLTRLPYQQSVDNLLEEWDKGIIDEVLTTAGGVIGGAVAGIPLGPWGMLGGAVLGGASSLMNKDETNRMAAQAAVSTGMIAEEAGQHVAAAHATSQWANIALSKLNVFGNSLAGGTDVFTGNWNDNESEAARVRGEGNVGALVAQGVTGFADAMLTAGSGVGAMTYLGLSEGSAVASAATKAMGDGEWDEVTGSFHKYESIEQRMAAAGSSAIDVAQGMLPGVLRQTAARGIGGSGSMFSNKVDDVIPTNRVTVMDTTYKLNAQGVAVGAERNLLGWVAPSSIVNKLSVRGSALAENARRGGVNPVNVDDMYRAAVRLENAAVPWKLAMINGFGEASEEVLQTYLNATAVGWQAEPMEYVQAAIAGFSMGAGMGIGSRFGTVSQERRELWRANSLRRADGLDPFTLQEWREKPAADKTLLSTPVKSAERFIRQQNKQQIADWTERGIISQPAIYEAEDALRATTKRKTTVGEGSLEDMADILPFQSVRIPSYHILHSAKTTIEKLQARSEGLLQMVNEGNQDAAPIQATLQDLLDRVIMPAYQSYESRGNVDALRQINEALQSYWNGTREQRRAVELVFSRSPNDNQGSFAMLLPQIDAQLTADKIDGMSKVSQSLEKVLSHDNDGDKIKHQARYVPDDVSRRVLRMGINLWAATGGRTDESTAAVLGGGGFLNVANRSYEDATLQLMHLDFTGTDAVAKDAVTNTYDAIIDILQEGLGDAVRPSTLRDFRKDLETNPEGAKASFYKALSADAGKLIDLGEKGTSPSRNVSPEARIAPETSIGLWIEDQIQIALNNWQTGAALRVQTEFTRPEAEGAQPQALPADAQTVRGQAAATKGQTLEMITGGSDAFRSRAKLAYGLINSSAMDANGVVNPDALREGLIQWYSVLTRMRALSQTDTVLQGGNPVLTEARTDLETIARMYYPEEYKTSPEATLLMIATTPYYDISEQQTTNYDSSLRTKRDTTVAQVLLRNAAERQGALVPTALGELDLTVAYNKMNAGQAAIALMGEPSLDRILTADEAAWLGQFETVRSASKAYAARGGIVQRKQWRDHAKQHPSYKMVDGRGQNAFSDDTAPSMYRLVVDTIRMAVDSELAHDPKGTGHASGRLAQQDRTFHEKTLLPTFNAVRDIVRELGITDSSSRQELMDLLSDNSQAVQYVLRMFTPEMRVRIIGRPDEAGAPAEVVLPQWFFDILLEPNAERAAMLFFNANFDLELEAWRDRLNENDENQRTPSNTWVDLYMGMDQAGRQEFDDMRANATNVQSFVDRVNQTMALNRPPMLAWRTDSSLFDPSVTRGGWQWSSPSAERRQAVMDAHAYLTTRAASIRGDLDLSTSNLGLAQSMLSDLESRDLDARNKAQARLTALENRLVQAQTLSTAAMGPSGIREFVMMAQEGLDIASAQKGKPGPRSAQFGDTDVRREQTTFDSQLGQVIGSIAAVDAKSLSFNPQMLTRPLRIQTNTGTTIDWNPVDARAFLELFTADGGAYQGLLFDLISPSIYEENATGHTSYHHLLPKNLESIIDSTIHKELLLGEGGRDADENDELFIAYVNALTPDNNIVRLMSKLAIARTTGSLQAQSQLGNESYRRIVRDVASALRDLSGMTVDGANAASLTMRQTAIVSYLASRDLDELNTAYQNVFVTGDMSGLETLAKAYTAETERIRQNYNSQPTEQGAIELIDAMQRQLQATQLIHMQSTNDIMQASLRIEWDTPNELMVRSAVSQYIDVFGTVMMTTATGDDRMMLEKYSQAQQRSLAADGLVNLPDRSDWEHLAKLVSLHNTLRDQDTRAASFVPTALVDDFQYFDPTFQYLGEYLTTPEIHQATQKFRDMVFDVKPPRITPEAFRKNLESSVLNPKYLGTWTQDLVVQHLGADRALDASGSEVQINIGGLTPKNYLASNIAARRTNEHPPAEMARNIVIDAKVFADESSSPWTLGNGLDGEPWAILEGAHVVAARYDAATKQWTGTGPTLVVRDANGREVERISLHNAQRGIQNGGTPAEGSPTTIKAVTVEGLRQASMTAMTRAKSVHGDSVTATIELQMFHPADKPADPKWANNMHFDGTLGETDVASSLYSALSLQTDGLVQRLQRAALDAIKGYRAIFSQPQPKDQDEKDVNNLNLVIHEMTKKVLMTQIGSKYYLPISTYRAIYRMMRDHLVVVGEDADGNTQVFSSEQALTEMPEGLSDLRVVELSRETLETLRGSTSGSGHARLLDRAPLPGGEADGPWQGSFSPEQLARVPELGRRLSLDSTQSAAERVGTARGIGAAFRSSGLLSTERSTTFRYKNWTAADRVLRHRPEETFRAEREQTRDARVKPEFYQGILDQNRLMLEELARTVRSTSRVNEATKDVLKQDIGGVPRNDRIRRASEASTLADLNSYLANTKGRIWLYQHNGTGLRNDGILTSFNIAAGAQKDHIAPVDDMVWIDLSFFVGRPGTPEWNTEVRRVVADARELGLTVAFTHPSEPGAVGEAESLILSPGSGYGRLRAGMDWLYGPTNPEMMQQTVIARQATMLQTQVQSLENTAIIAVDNSGYVVADAEGVLADPRADQNNFGRSVTSNIVPTTGAVGYGAPASASAGARISAVLKQLDTPEGVEYLVNQAIVGGSTRSPEELAAEIAPLIAKASANLNETTGLPNRNTMLEPGDIIALVHGQTGAVMLTRWGYDPSDVDFAAQSEVPFDGITRQGIASSGSIRFVGDKQIKQDYASLNRGRIERWVTNDPVHGLRVIQTLPISAGGAKFIGSMTGKKSRAVNADDRLPSVPLLGRLWPNFYDNMAGRIKKGATEGMVTSSREAIFFFGWDAGRALANAIGIRPNGWTVAEWAAETDREGIIAQVRAELEVYRQNISDRFSNGIDVANAVMKSVESTEAAQLLVAQRRDRLGLAAAQARTIEGSKDPSDIERQYLAAVLEFLRGDGTRISDVLGAPGFNQPSNTENKESYRMPAALTDFIDMNPGLRQYIVEDINSRMTGNTYEADGTLATGWWVGSDWKVTTRDDKGRTAQFTLQTERIDATGEDQTERVETNRLTATNDTASDQQQTVASSLGLDLGYAVRNKALDSLLKKRGFADLQAASRGTSADRARGPVRPLTRGEQTRRSRATRVAQGYLTPLDRGQWDSEDSTAQDAMENYRKIYNVLGLTADGRYQDLVDSLVRTFYRHQHDDTKEFTKSLRPDEVKFATDHILAQLAAGRAPVMEGRMPAIHAEILDLIAVNGTWVPEGVTITDNRRVALLEWGLDTTFASTSDIAPDGQLELDGLILSYEKVLDQGFYSSSAFPEVIQKILDPSSGLFKSSIDPLTQMHIQRGDPYADVDNKLDVTGVTNQSETPASKLSLATQTEIARRRRRDIERGATNGGLDRSTPSETLRKGRTFRDEVHYTNAFFRDWHAIRTIVPQLNPFLWIWNPVDMAARLAPEQATALLNGTSTGVLGRGIRRGISAMAEASKNVNPESRVQSFLDAFGLQKPYIDDEANALLKPVVDRLVGDVEWRSHIAQETRHRPNDAMSGRREQALQRAVDGTSKIQDVMHGIPPRSQAELYIQGILEHERIENPNVTAVDVLLRLRDKPLAYMQDGPRTAHNVASNKIKNIKAAGQTTIGVALNSLIMPLASSSNGVVNSAANTLLILTKFRNFAFSSARFLTGAYGLDAAAAILMQGRIGGQRARGLQGKVGNPGMTTDYISEVLESADLADAFIKSGLSWTGLFFAGLGLAASGITGEDEEERRRRRIEQLSGLGQLYDPRDVANDWRNRDALYLEGFANIPGLGWLSSLAQVPSEPGQPERWPVQPHWTVNFFISPIVGMAEFLQTGEFGDLVKGFENAVGQMPLVNTNFFWDAVNVSHDMYINATNEVPEDPGELANINSIFLKIFGTLEKATFELAFINELVSTVDTYNRNPWGLPDLLEDGQTIRRDLDGVPQQTPATDQEITVDPVTGEEIVIDKRQTRSYDEGLWRNFAQNNQTFALFATMVTGFQFNKAGSFMRGDQAVAQKTIAKDDLSTEDAELLIMSVWDPNNEQEVLTRDGMEALFRSLHAETVSATDPALQNIFITPEQREEIQESLQTKITLEGMEVYGLSADEAAKRMWDIWYGPDNNPYVTPLADVVWGRGKFADENGIPFNQTTTYRQLNTTWVTGPDGRMWATGVSRGTLADFFSPFKGYQGSVGGDIRGNLDIDGLLNSVDPMANINTGMRSLTRVDDSLFQPDEQDIIDKMDAITDKVIDAIKNLNSDLMGDNGFGRGGYGFGRRGGGGGGGGGGYSSNPYMPFLNGMRAPYLDNVPQIYINNVNPRRSSIRRERFSSEKGRLNNQQ
ncbi:hypothetical protein SEA_PHEDRO_31 [Microbacterium phage Phedro]|uniref:Uncharacterized protein n=2 Tax=Akonivirus phedro TaxID=2845594 RepID=A0A8F3E9X9_9CAUD|nr:hypothetical protein HWD33_gp31 [Microbacterium phage Phedro]QJD52938.1 hypothetical protein SEA_PHEDRO_31 [Microbacterium phage Phedro]QWY82723.1 hypothetical protein SEA_STAGEPHRIGHT_31 [Microbacterium phage StagePhright]